MGIKMTTPIEEVENYINRKVEENEDLIIRKLAYVGEQCVNHVRTLPSPLFPVMKQHLIPPHQPNFIDWSSNLRSSTGYALIKDGEIIQMSDFAPVKEGAKGKEEGEAYIHELAKNQSIGKIKSGIVLIVVAGMNYAGYVANLGYDVLDSAELLAEKLVPQLLSELGFEKA
jgi:hypothetical protein